jgi:hypothetical protein
MLLRWLPRLRRLPSGVSGVSSVRTCDASGGFFAGGGVEQRLLSFEEVERVSAPLGGERFVVIVMSRLFIVL